MYTLMHTQIQMTIYKRFFKTQKENVFTSRENVHTSRENVFTCRENVFTSIENVFTTREKRKCGSCLRRLVERHSKSAQQR